MALELDPTRGDVVRLEGLYEVDPIPGGKRFQGAWLVLDDGTRYVIAYRPVPEHFGFLEKRVVIRGRRYMPGPDTQHIQAMHLEVHSIELGPDETPHASLPVGPLKPPVARNAAELAARVGRWVRVIGTLEWVCEDPDGYLGIGQLCLKDGAKILARNVPMKRWSCFEGEEVEVTSRVAQTHEDESAANELIGWYAIERAQGGRDKSAQVCFSG